MLSKKQFEKPQKTSPRKFGHKKLKQCMSKAKTCLADYFAHTFFACFFVNFANQSKMSM